MKVILTSFSISLLIGDLRRTKYLVDTSILFIVCNCTDLQIDTALLEKGVEKFSLKNKFN